MRSHRGQSRKLRGRLYRPVVLALLLGLVGLICAYVTAVYLPSRLVSVQSVQDGVERLRLQNAVRATLLQGLAGVLFLVTAFFTYWQIQVNRDGQITERFSRAVDQLGSDKLDTRLGGLYALARIAKASGDDREAIVRILVAYVQHHASASGTDNASGLEPPMLAARAADVQVALTLLARNAHEWGIGDALEFRNVDLRGADLSDGHFNGAVFDGAFLDNSVLGRAELERTRFQGTSLRLTDFAHADLKSAGFRQSQLQGTRFLHADVRRADFEMAILDGAQLADANLENATFSGVEAKKADFSRAILRSASLVYARLQGTVMYNCHLEGTVLAGANLQEAQLCGAYFKGADLRDADLRGADLADAHLEDARLDGANLQEALSSSGTKWPTGFDWQGAGVKEVSRPVTYNRPWVS